MIATLAGCITSSLSVSITQLPVYHLLTYSPAAAAAAAGQEEGGAAKVLFPIFPSSPLLGPRLTLGHSVLSPIVAGINCYQL